MPKNTKSTKQPSLLSYLLLLTCFFMLMEISFFIVCNKAYLIDYTYISGQLKIPAGIVPDILFYLTAQLCIHMGYCFLVWFVAFFTGYLCRLSEDQQFKFSITLWLVGIGAAFAGNQHFFPHSKFSALSALFFLTPSVAGYAALLLTSIFCLAIALGLAGFLVWSMNKSFNYALMLLLIFAASSWVGLTHMDSSFVRIVKHKQPHVIIVGIDSLRPDFLGFFGADHPTDFLDSLLMTSTVFSEAVTPLARTFPSWSAILLGEYPRQSGVRSNLAKIDNVKLSKSLPAIFKEKGYQTIFATDETRFSNIDYRFGFNQVITPPTGLNDFLLGTFNDFPFSNLLVNTSIGHWLFPYSYANRPAHVTYQPESFLSLIRPSLMRSHDQPLFMAVHFCLPHFPFSWADSPTVEQSAEARYHTSITRVDQQLKSFFAMLTEAHLLDHAIVILLSDHGEAMELKGDRITERDNFIGVLTQDGHVPRFYPPSRDTEEVNQSAGHGTDVLGLPQFHSLLAFRLFGMGEQHVAEVAGVVPLVDIKPTVLSLAGIHTSPDTSVLAAIIRGEATSVPRQHVFIESDFSPESIRTVYPETRQVMLEGVQLFEVDAKTARLTLKDSMNKMIIHSKQYADIYGEWMLALYPQSNAARTPILINLKSGKWTNDIRSTFARQAPTQLMLTQLKHFYGDELNTVIGDNEIGS